MDTIKIMSLLAPNDYIKPVRFYKVVMAHGTKSCNQCLRLAGEIFVENDSRMPALPLHPNCRCSLVEVNQEEYIKQNSYNFGSMSHGEWDHQDEEKKYLWCNAFRKHFGNSIDQYVIRYNIPKQLLAGVIANEMLD